MKALSAFFASVSLLAASQAVAATKVIKFYGTPHAKPNPGCDIHTRGTLKVNGNAGTLTLEEAVSGFCEIAVIPNTRTYQITLNSTGCGSLVYNEDSSDSRVALVDNTKRICEDVIPALYVLKELKIVKSGDGHAVVELTRYSSP